MVRREEPPSYADCGRGVAFSYPPGKPHHQPVPAAHLFSVPPPVARLNPPTLYSNPAHRSQPITPAPCPPRSSSYPAGKPPTAPPANIPTSQQVEKPKSWHTKKPIHQEVGNLESWKTKKPRSRKPGKLENQEAKKSETWKVGKPAHATTTRSSTHPKTTALTATGNHRSNTTTTTAAPDTTGNHRSSAHPGTAAVTEAQVPPQSPQPETTEATAATNPKKSQRRAIPIYTP